MAQSAGLKCKNNTTTTTTTKVKAPRRSLAFKHTNPFYYSHTETDRFHFSFALVELLYH